MKIPVGGRSVRVVVADAEIPGTFGEALGLSDETAGTVALAGNGLLDPNRRLEVTAHEYEHWFEWAHGGPPLCPEERADWFATAFCGLCRALESAGGEAALKRLKPGGETMSPGEALACGGPLHPEEPYATECPGCTAMIGAGSVVRSVAVPHSDGRPVVWMAMMCHDCGDLWRWACAAAEGGGCTAAVVIEPERVTERREIAAFVNAHPRQAAAVLV